MINLFNLIHHFWLLLQQGQLPDLGNWNYLLLGFLVAVEGPLATLLGAAAASAGLMRLGVVFLVAAIGNLAADLLWYMVGYHGNIDSAVRLGRFAHIQRSQVNHLTKAMQDHGLKILFFAKLTAGFMIPSLIAAGLVRLPWKRWLPVLLLGETIWTGTLVLIGYYTTEAIKVVAKDISQLIWFFTILFLVVLLWQGRRILMKNREFSEAVGPKEND